MNTVPETDHGQLLSTLRLLYVEDDPEALQELGHFLRRKAASLAVASNGAEALALCRNHQFDAILCDLWMPEMDGLTFIRHLRQDGDQTPVIITSALSDSETILKAVDLGIAKYCVKPLEADDLLDCLCRIAAERLTESGQLVLPGNRLLVRQERLETEKALKSGYAHLLKQLTGKGPKDVQASLGTDSVALWATEVLTPLEQSLLSLSGNSGLVSYLRRMLYTGNQGRFETLVSESLEVSATLADVRIGLQENTDHLVFRIK